MFASFIRSHQSQFSENQAAGLPTLCELEVVLKFFLPSGQSLCRCISVSSKTRMSQRVAVLHLVKETLEANVKAGSVWKVHGYTRL